MKKQKKDQSEPVEKMGIKRHFLADKKIVMVEDDPFLRELYNRIFERESIPLSIAEDGEEGFALIEKTVPEIVLLDVMLPGLTGIEVLSKIHDDPKLHKKVQVVMLTDLDQMGVEERAMSLGAVGFLSKNEVSGPDLLKQVEKLFKDPLKNGL